MWPPLNRVGEEFIGATRKERPCFAAERGLDRLGHTSLRMVYWGHTKGTALFCCRMRHEHSSPFSDPKIWAPSTKSSWSRIYWSHTKRTALFCCRTWPRPPWAHKPPDGLLGAHERNGAVLLQNAASTPLGTHEHSRVHFLILRPGLPLLNGVGAEFIGVARKERRCFAAERGLDRLGHASLRMVYWGHTKGTALFCCRTRPQSLWAHTSTRGSIF